MHDHLTKPDSSPATGLLAAAIHYAESDPDNLEAVHFAIDLLRQRQLLGRMFRPRSRNFSSNGLLTEVNDDPAYPSP